MRRAICRGVVTAAVAAALSVGMSGIAHADGDNDSGITVLDPAKVEGVGTALDANFAHVVRTGSDLTQAVVHG